MDVKYRSIAEAVLLMGLVILGGLQVGDLIEEKAFFCSSKEVAMNCNKLSSGTGSRCYFDKADGSTSYKICPEGWVKFSHVIAGQEVQVLTLSPEILVKGDFTTSPDGKICYAQGNLRRGAPCGS